MFSVCLFTRDPPLYLTIPGDVPPLYLRGCPHYTSPDYTSPSVPHYTWGVHPPLYLVGAPPQYLTIPGGMPPTIPGEPPPYLNTRGCITHYTSPYQGCAPYYNWEVPPTIPGGVPPHYTSGVPPLYLTIPVGHDPTIPAPPPRFGQKCWQS